tara:strand:+ start:124 stop:330 length:207 start_codon:yes stop_codon:yes gene_type:complete
MKILLFLPLLLGLSVPAIAHKITNFEEVGKEVDRSLDPERTMSTLEREALNHPELGGEAYELKEELGI